MVDPNAARRYLTPPHKSFWQWEDGGRVITWPDGKTILFREELLEILRRLAPRGLPPLEAIMLLAAATRYNWRDALGGPWFQKNFPWLRGTVVPETAWDEWLANVFSQLDRVHQLDADLRSTMWAKAELADLVFARTRNRTSPETAIEILRMVEDGPGEDIVVPSIEQSQKRDGLQVLIAGMGCLREGLPLVDADTLRLRRRTGFDQLVQPATIDLPQSECVRALIARLEHDDEFRGLAGLARNLMAAITLPRNVSDHEDLPMGGVSDISNRGPLDRLLLSELAHDDLTLSVRVAINEALYLRRESPPRTPPRWRAVLLETGLRSWGAPRVFATAAALAIAAKTDRHAQVIAYRAKGDQVLPVDLTTREGLVQHLETLESEAHPGRALDAFYEAIGQCGTPADPVLITTEDVLADHEFARALNASRLLPVHVATVSRNGRFRLLSKNVQGTRTLGQATLKLDELMSSGQHKPVPLIDRSWARDLPAILSIHPLPLLLPHTVDMERMWYVERHGMLAVTSDRRLMQWTRSGLGARQLADNLPHGVLHWCTTLADNSRVFAVVGWRQSDNLHLLDVHLEEPSCSMRQLELSGKSYRAVCADRGALLAIAKDHVEVLDQFHGGHIQRFDLPENIQWQQGRFFRKGGQWLALSYDGTAVHLEPALDEKAVRCPKLVAMFERQGVDGAIGLTTMGDLYFTGLGQLKTVKHGIPCPVMLSAVSHNGARILIRSTPAGPHTGGQARVISVDSSEPVTGPLNPEISRLVRPVNLRKRFGQIFVGEGKLTLVSRNSKCFKVEYTPVTNCFILPESSLAPERWGPSLSFQSRDITRYAGYELSVATWPDGSQAFLDSRGMLHLRSSDAGVQEMTLVLRDGSLPGWCSVGGVWGPRYFTGLKGDSAPTPAARKTLEDFVARLR